MAKVLVSFDDALLRRIDRSARARGLSRSAYLAELAARDTARLHASTRRTLRDLDGLFALGTPGESTDAIRIERDAR